MMLETSSSYNVWHMYETYVCVYIYTQNERATAYIGLYNIIYNISYIYIYKTFIYMCVRFTYSKFKFFA